MRSSQMGNYGILTMFCCLWRIWLSRIWHNLTDLIMFSLLEGEPLLSFSVGGCYTCTRTFGVTKEWWRMTKTPDLTLEFDDPFVLNLLLCVCPGQEVQIQSARTAFPIIPFSARCHRAVRPCLKVVLGLSVWLPVSVSGAARSSDSAGGAAGPSRVQPSPCDTLSVTDPPPRGDTAPASPLSCPPQAIGLFAATLQSLIEWPGASLRGV